MWGPRTLNADDDDDDYSPNFRYNTVLARYILYTRPSVKSYFFYFTDCHLDLVFNGVCVVPC